MSMPAGDLRRRNLLRSRKLPSAVPQGLPLGLSLRLPVSGLGDGRLTGSPRSLISRVSKHALAPSGWEPSTEERRGTSSCRFLSGMSAVFLRESAESFDMSNV